MPQIFQSTVNEICKVNYAELPEQIKDWITEHPHQTTFHVFNGIVFFYPGLIPGPILWSLGWTSTGPRPGKSPLAPSYAGLPCTSRPTDSMDRITSSGSHGKIWYYTQQRHPRHAAKRRDGRLWHSIGGRRDTCCLRSRPGFRLAVLGFAWSGIEQSEG